MNERDRCSGCLAGQAIGDAMGLPFENLSPRRIAKLGRFDRPQFFFGFGAGSDDTEHAGMTADAVRYSQGDLAKFEKRLASSLRRWFLAGPPGIGLATLQACLKLCLGFGPKRSGVHSAGNGPAMRAAIIGVLVPEERLGDFVRVSTRITHTDPMAEAGSLLVAQLASCSATIDTDSGAEWIRERIAGLEGQKKLEPLASRLKEAAVVLADGGGVEDCANRIAAGRGVGGFIAETVPVAIVAFFRHADDYATGIERTVRCGGDTDTVAAIAGALIGSRVGIDGIPQIWRERYRDWPWSIERLISMNRPPLWLWPVLVVRNLGFFAVVLGHILRRLLPPW